MGIICDTHMHSSFSGDSRTPLRDMAAKANDLGLKMICFTEHMDFNFPYPEGEEGMFDLNTDSYLYELLKVRSEYEGRMEIGYGVELGLKEDAVRQNAIYIKNHEFDYVIASLHLVNEMDPYYPEFYEFAKKYKTELGSAFNKIEYIATTVSQFYKKHKFIINLKFVNLLKNSFLTN